MKKILSGFILLSLIFPYSTTSEASPQSSLSEIYKTGKIQLVPELVITDDNLPDGILFMEPRNMSADPEGNIIEIASDFWT